MVDPAVAPLVTFDHATTAGLQIITLAELFQGKKPDMPFVDPASVKRAKREDTESGKQGNLI